MKYPLRGGQYLTKSLFYEKWTLYTIEQRGDNKPAFTLLGKDIDGLINAQRTFVELNDPTGYKWAIQYLDSWPHFLVLMKCGWFKEAFDEWVAELEVKLRSESISKLRDIAASGTPQAVAAAKYLATLDYKKVGGSRGRPSKEELVGELKRQARHQQDSVDDAKRIGLVHNG